MNREILFRGKRVDNGEWVYGSLVNNVFFKADKIAIPYIFNPENCDSAYCFEDFTDDFGYYEVIPETVGQFTGLIDKKGANIFEGDIIKYLTFYTTSYHSSDLYGDEPQNSRTIYEEYLEDATGVIEFQEGEFSINKISLNTILNRLGDEVINHYLFGCGRNEIEFLECFDEPTYTHLSKLKNEELYPQLKKEIDILSKQVQVIRNIHENQE